MSLWDHISSIQIRYCLAFKGNYRETTNYLNAIYLSKQLRATAVNCCQWFCYICACLGLQSLFIGVAGRRSILCGQLSGFPFPSPLSTVDQCDGCLCSLLRWGSRLGCQVLLAMGAVSILELAANSGSSRMSRAPILHLTTRLLNNNKIY